MLATEGHHILLLFALHMIICSSALRCSVLFYTFCTLSTPASMSTAFKKRLDFVLHVLGVRDASSVLAGNVFEVVDSWRDLQPELSLHLALENVKGYSGLVSLMSPVNKVVQNLQI